MKYSERSFFVIQHVKSSGCLTFSPELFVTHAVLRAYV